MEDHDRVDALFSPHALDDKGDYRAFLIAHARALGALEPAARPAAPRLPLLERDLDALDTPMPAPMVLPENNMENGGDGYRWGLLYALEGSRLGGAMLARRVGADLPKSYLSATHGKGDWIAFQTAMDVAGMEGGEGWLDAAVQGARAAFALFAGAAQAVVPARAHG
ncbi:MAG: biliverdin-producing heme oxygenase [Sphingobium sp.]